MHLSRRAIVLLIFLLSGIAGLVYEVVWTRQLVLVFGNTTQAISAILTGFFAGMAVGSVLGGRLADRVRSPLRLYGILELLLVILVLLTPISFVAIREIYRGAFENLESAPQALTAVRFVLAILALAPSTIMMGATLPALSRHLVRDHRELGTEFGKLYTINTIGAVIGTVAAGFVLIEVLGLGRALVFGALCSATAGVSALLLSRWWPEPGLYREFRPAKSASAGEPATISRPAPERPAPSDRVSRPRLALAVAFVSGLTSLGYQTLWTRLSSSGSDNSTYVFTTILACFLIGIAIGAAAYSAVLSRTRRPVLLLGVAQLVLAVLVIFGLAVETRALFSTGTIPSLLIAVLPATLVLGITFPMSSTLVAENDNRVGTSAGLLLGVNTAGAIIGSFVVPFVLIPWLSSPRAVVLLAVVNAALGVTLLAAEREIKPRLRLSGTFVGGLVSIAAIALFAFPNPIVLDPAINSLERANATIALTAEDEIASVQAGSNANGVPQLWVGGVSMTTITVDAQLMPLLSLALRPESKSICEIAFGMGTSYRSGLIDGLKVEAIELVPSVPDMYGYYYKDAAQVLANPNGDLIVADGRNHIELTTHRYDLVMADPPPPSHSSGAGVLYSQEFYKAVRAHLNPGGVMMEWIPYDMNIDEFRAHVQTFHSVFENDILVFGPGKNGVFMLGSAQALSFDPEVLKSILARPGVLADLVAAPDSPIYTEDATAWTNLLMGQIWIQGAQVAAFAGNAPLITDDRPYTEYYLVRKAMDKLFGTRPLSMNQKNLQAATPAG
jgi:spermidine synthase